MAAGSIRSSRANPLGGSCKIDGRGEWENEKNAAEMEEADFQAALYGVYDFSAFESFGDRCLRYGYI